MLRFHLKLSMGTIDAILHLPAILKYFELLQFLRIIECTYFDTYHFE